MLGKGSRRVAGKLSGEKMEQGLGEQGRGTEMMVSEEELIRGVILIESIQAGAKDLRKTHSAHSESNHWPVCREEQEVKWHTCGQMNHL